MFGNVGLRTVDAYFLYKAKRRLSLIDRKIKPGVSHKFRQTVNSAKRMYFK